MSKLQRWCAKLRLAHQLFGDDLIQQRRFWIARPVSVDSHEGIAECTSTRNSLHHRFSNFRAGRHGEVRLRNDYIPRLSRFCRLPFAVRINTPFNAVFLVQRHFWHSTWWTYWSPRG